MWSWSQYLDSKELHSHLGRYRRTLLGTVLSRGLSLPPVQLTYAMCRIERSSECADEDNANEWVVPVFLFDVSHSDILLIDRTHQVRTHDGLLWAPNACRCSLCTHNFGAPHTLCCVSGGVVSRHGDCSADPA
jgi:hypothetical protein